MTTQERQTKLSRLYSLLDDQKQRITRWQDDFGKPMPYNAYTWQLARVITSTINQLELA